MAEIVYEGYVLQDQAPPTGPTINLSPVPEPGRDALVGLGLIGLAVLRRLSQRSPVLDS